VDVHGGLGKSKLQFLFKKIFKNFQLYFSVIKTLDPFPDPDSLEILDTDLYPVLNSMNPDPQHC
jgi:hypothetical protein